MISSNANEDSFEKNIVEVPVFTVCETGHAGMLGLMLLVQIDQHVGQERSVPSQIQGTAQPQYVAS